ncbi:hypothetical protein BCU68_02140 [Vibrio sp. 10N.286.49.B3]|uniref:regulatory protein ToxS n=1 Tax=Vibrio sp. 10N.286.49.B3 TaxID=1880855 RepID=UPI000C827411|nr:regulatory protein ToxS [Vibrio sp. 10N.286.49.B3]PMH46862.1 hypothetical protein BCU68_02140 [Vibrio sp. 10N.286.49.B3]
MKLKFASLLLVISAILTSWLYWGSDLKIEQMLTANEWHSRMVTILLSDEQEDILGPLSKVVVTSNVKYLPNSTYIRISSIHVFGNNELGKNIINISETGNWDISDNYLLVSPTAFSDSSSTTSREFTSQQLKVITQVFKLDSELSRRIDIIDSKTLLLTSLSHGSTVLFSN